MNSYTLTQGTRVCKRPTTTERLQEAGHSLTQGILRVISIYHLSSSSINLSNHPRDLYSRMLRIGEETRDLQGASHSLRPRILKDTETHKESV